MSAFNVYRENIGLKDKPQYQVTFVVEESGRSIDGFITLSPSCIQTSEIDHWADKLIASINDARDSAKESCVRTANFLGDSRSIAQICARF
jgi:hypothetical protein